MKNSIQTEEEVVEQERSLFTSNLQRRSFLKYAGAGAASVALVAAGCKKDNDNEDRYNFGTGDIAILNYAYALEQLEAAFYLQVMASPFAGMTDTERGFLVDIREHEIAHRELFKAALAGDAIGDLTPNFTSINFNDRTSVLGTAKAFEDLGVSAYNGAGFLIQNVDYLALAGKIVSVEARHAALIRDLISNGTFVTDEIVPPSNAVEISRSPTQVLAIAGAFLATPINTSGLPTY